MVPHVQTCAPYQVLEHSGAGATFNNYKFGSSKNCKDAVSYFCTLEWFNGIAQGDSKNRDVSTIDTDFFLFYKFSYHFFLFSSK